MRKLPLQLFVLFLGIETIAQDKRNEVLPNENLITENIAPISKELLQKVKKYAETRGAGLSAVHPIKDEVIVFTRFGSTNQLHKVTQPLGTRTQITFFEEPIANASYEPVKGEYLIYSRDAGGNEFGQLYKLDLKTGQSTLLTDGGRSQNGNITWKKEGSGFYFSSTKRNGADRDIYYINPNYPSSTRLVLEVKGGGWSITDISEDGKKLLITESISANESHIWMLDTTTSKLTEITNRTDKGIVQTNANFSKKADEIWFTTDRDNEFKRLALFNLQTKKISYLTSSIPWDVESYDLSEDKTKLVFTTNEGGVHKLYLMETATKQFKAIPNIHNGLIGSMRFTKEGQNIFFSQSTADSSSDVYKLNLKTQKITRWTESELGEMQKKDMSIPKQIEWKSFDGMKISGFYYPASQKFTGKRPVLISIHGGPEGQSLASFLGANNYYTNEMGVALIYPNVRGSSGFGKTYLAKDNGFLREDSVKDIGALLDWIAQQPDLDQDRIMIMGGSYGGYMTLATAFHYTDKIRCSVDVVGISNFNTFLKNTENYRRDLRRVEYGDERDPKMYEFLDKISPLNNTDKIKKPMFIIQGTNDPRVPVTEATQMRDKLKAKGNVVWYLEAKDEGHGFRKKANIDFQRLAVIRYMEEYLLK
ncbi:S9 family peptidase [Flavobacterium columnare]|uniref:S9 family peptidase n=1 Tax=Flavobacterium columnare TaxID=996 RepID=A0AAI8GC44_9FLAO|nr:prolyl oligopeptidase family serine peptidase [Flavobacterium columnare]AMO21476.2 S9 family peptidase [Flavobacterium columnare]QOG57484.1 S9 family peptidase [Flavobacterium columnare]QOG60208.1 S9 family peptidase [Flavobacterium columnare]QOG62928.1 S9 family peptidase [Flavobacterium columnare]QOG65651.1 S9 family peptidase [Flavobacterium columnare]